jgi:hypothetical protein
MAGYIGSKTSVTQVDGYNRTEADDEFVNDPNGVLNISASASSDALTLGADNTLSVAGKIDAKTAPWVGFSGQIQFGQTGFVANYSGGANVQTLVGNNAYYNGGYRSIQAGTKAAFMNAASGEFTFNSAPETTNAGDVLAMVELMKIDSSGNLLVGKTSAATNVQGGELRENGQVLAVATNVNPFFGARLGSNGDIAVFRKDSTTVGSIGSHDSQRLTMGNADVGLIYQTDGTDYIGPFNMTANTGRDNAIDLGISGNRFDDIYATNGTIQTSDRNEKQDIEALSDAEQRVAVACKGLLRKFRWIDAVAEKGDDARIHFGIIAQDLQDAFAAEGLDAGRYAMFISSTWWETQTEVPAVEAVAEVLDEDGNVVTEAVEAKEAYTRTDTYETLEETPEGATERTRLGVRYPELLAFIIGAM